MNIKINKSKKGFTLLEVLLVIALMTILFAISLVAINPRKQLAQARNLQRKSDIDIIYKALEYYKVSQKSYPTGITGEPKAICIDGNTPSNCVDLSSLVPEYLADIPTDPSGVAYQIYINSTNGVIGVEAAGSELGQSIVVNPIPIITSTPTPTPTPAPTIVQNGLILHLDAGDTLSYPGDGTSWFNLSNNSYTFTLRNNPIYSSDNGGSFYFNGTSDAHIAPPITTVTQNVSMQVWVNIEDTSRKGFFFHNGSNSEGYGFGVGNNTLDSSGNELIGLYDNRRWIDTNTNLGTGWKFVTMVIDSSGNPTFYINNTSLGTFEGVTPLAPGSFTNVASDEANRKFTGNIGQVYFYNTALTSSEVQQNYDVTKARYGL